jgi:signal peptidase II
VKRSLAYVALVAAVVVALDRWTKRWADAELAFRPPLRIVGDYIRLNYARNSGVAFGIGHGTGFPYYVFSLVAIAGILWMFLTGRVGPGRGRRFTLGLVLGGAVGNLVDRVTSGEVVDFIEVGIPSWHWPIFNVADSAITVGILLLALAWSRPAAGSPFPGVPAAGSDEPPGPARS